jgi:Rrf2 family transcriptional regulator, iron-sulfur cluster assembly transcription factor
MRITAQEEYGLRCVIQLAMQPHGEPISVKEIAAREGLSVAYVEKLLYLLNRAGLAKSTRGINGGYCLAQPPEKISLGEVIRALGGFASGVEVCNQFTGNLDSCVHLENCGLRPLWRVAFHVQSMLDRVSLAQLLHDENQVETNLIEKSRAQFEIV